MCVLRKFNTRKRRTSLTQSFVDYRRGELRIYCRATRDRPTNSSRVPSLGPHILNSQTNGRGTDARESSWLPVLKPPFWRRITWPTCNDAGCSEENRAPWNARYELGTIEPCIAASCLRRDYVHLASGNFNDDIACSTSSEESACCWRCVPLMFTFITPIVRFVLFKIKIPPIGYRIVSQFPIVILNEILQYV